MTFEKEKNELKQRIDDKVRHLYADERKLNEFQLNEKLYFVTNSLWNTFQDVLSPIRHQIQELESKILVSRFKLNENLNEYCKSKKEFKRTELELEQIEKNMDSHHDAMRHIEEKSGYSDSDGDLKRLPIWVFWSLMFVVGIAELMIYYKVFLSQEIGSTVDADNWLQELLHQGSALIMGIGFTVMLIWLAHKLGMMLRQYNSVKPKFIKVYWIKFFIILAVVVAAIIATVKIRTTMHQIFELEQKIASIQNNYDTPTMDLSMDMPPTNSMTDETDSSSNEAVMEEEEEEEVMGVKDTIPKSSDKVDPIDNLMPAQNSSSKTTDELRSNIIKLKSETSQLFIFINLFILLAGMFLSYEIHTSNVQYEALESLIQRLHKKRDELRKHKKNLEKELAKNEKGDLLNVINEYVQTVNTFDEYSQIVRSYKINIENIYIEMVYYLFGSMMEHNLLIDIDLDVIKQYTPDYLSNRFKEEWRLNEIDIDVTEVIHINNIEEYLQLFSCSEMSNLTLLNNKHTSSDKETVNA